MTFSISPDRCFINAPFLDLENGLIDLFIEQRLQPEIGLEGNALYGRSIDDFKKIAGKLKKNKLACTLHAPFFDLAPGALDPQIRKITRQKLQLAFELIEVFHPKAIVCHLNFEDNKHSYKLDQWHEHATKTWNKLIDIAAAQGTTVMLENTYETTPDQHIRMLKTLNSPYARFCLDVGHLMAFADSPWQEWLPSMNPWLGHLHLHDNTGFLDSHNAIGLGNFDFTGLFNHLASHNLNPLVTLEPHTEDDLWSSLDELARMGVVTLGKGRD